MTEKFCFYFCHFANRYCHSRNEFTDEFIDLNLIIFCDTDRHIQTLWLVESPDRSHRLETENGLYLNSK